MNKILRYLTLALLGACLFNAAVCVHIIGMIVLTILTAVVLSYLASCPAGRLFQIGLVLSGVTALLWSGTQESVLFLSAISAACLLASGLMFISKRKRVNALMEAALCAGILWCLFQSPLPQLIIQTFKEPRIAFLERGHWGISQPHDGDLTIRAQYSYDMMKQIIGSEDTSDLTGLEAYTELWMVTPTQPFIPEEIQHLRSWIAQGGRLIVITDHTDLFGHASALNPFLATIGIQTQKNSLLDNTGDGGSYLTGLRSFKGLTANSVTGQGEAWLLVNGYAERADYGKNSFFSDNQISDEEENGIYAAGMTSPFGLGSIVLFGDSTLFANFALSRPSAQALLQKVLHAGKPFPCHTLAAMMILVFLGTLRRGKTQLVCLPLSLILFAGVLLYYGSPRREPSYHFAPTQEVWGDWTLAENNDSAYGVLFAASFAKSEKFPVWRGSSTEDGKITFSNGCVLESKTDIGQKDGTSQQKPWLPSSSWEERLNQPPSLSIDAFLETLIRDSRFSSFWFEEGVGPFKNEAYQRFWQRVTCQHPSKTMLSLLPPEQINGVLILNKEKRLPVRARMARLQGNENWVILGDWIIGKQVAPGTILIRNNWQHPSWGTNNVVLQMDTTKNQ